MRKTKMLLLATTAIATMAFAAPGVASAAEWVLPELEETAKTSYSGSLEFAFPNWPGTITCKAEASATLKPGTSGSVDGLTLKSCSGTGYFKKQSPCELTAASQSLPWALHAEGAAIDLEGPNVRFSFGEECGSPFNIAFKHATLTPDNPGAISTLSVSGILIGSNSKAEVHGNLEASQPKTYGIGFGNRWITTPKPLTKAATVEVSGSLGWMWSYQAGVNCTNVHGTLTLLPGSKAEAGSISVDPASCSGFGSYKECKITGASAGSLGVVEVTGNGKVYFEELQLVNEFSNCMWWSSVWGEVTAEPDKSSQISKLTIFQLVNIATSGAQGPGYMTGSLNLTPAGKYGIS